MKHRVRAAGILIEGDRLLLICERILSDGTKFWIPPGGGLEANGESLPDCVKREFREETGLTVEVGPLLYLREFSEPSRRTHHIEAFFRVTRLPHPPVACENHTMCWFTRDQIEPAVVLPDQIKRDFLAGNGLSGPQYLGISHEF
jgi:ADP-ribose pyrophosphatase YjhB (NUDIX family)